MNPYRIVEMGNGVTAIEEGAVRMFLVRGKTRAALIDTGFGGGALMRQVEELWPGPLTVVNTHGHMDHVGANRQFAQVLAHPADWPEICRNSGCGAEHLRPLQAGDRLELGQRTLEVRETPGHTPGSIVLLERDRRLLFGGDNVSDRPIFLCLPGASLREYLESLRRLQEWSRDYDIIYAAHGKAEQPVAQIHALICCCTCVQEGSLTGTELEPYGDHARNLYEHNGAAIYCGHRG